MGRLIDADALLKNCNLKDATKYGNKDAEQQNHSYSTMMLYEIADMIEDAPTVEAVPVVHGEWERISNRPKTYIRRCSVCSRESYTCFSSRDYNFCPWCGAKMDGKEKE